MLWRLSASTHPPSQQATERLSACVCVCVWVCVCACVFSRVHSPSRLGLRQVRQAPARLHWYSRVLTRSETRTEDKKRGRNKASPANRRGFWYGNCDKRLRSTQAGTARRKREQLGASGNGSAQAGIRKQTFHAGEAARPRRPFGAGWPGRACAAPREQTLGYSRVLNEVLARGWLLLGYWRVSHRG
jgi:hypothetical protein